MIKKASIYSLGSFGCVALKHFNVSKFEPNLYSAENLDV